MALRLVGDLLVRTSEEYMILKYAANAFTKRFTQGLLSYKSVKALQNKPGVIRPLEQMISGIERGNEKLIGPGNIRNVKGLEALTLARESGGYRTANGVVSTVKDSKWKYITPFHIPFIDSAQQQKLNSTIAIRHEAAELAEAGHGNRGIVLRMNNLPKLNNIQQKVLDHSKGPIITHVNDNFTADGMASSDLLDRVGDILKSENTPEPAIHKMVSRINLSTVGRHNNLAVLGRESNLVNQLKLHGANMERFFDLRKITGEDNLLKRFTNKQYGQQQFTSSDLKKLRKAPHDQLLSFSPIQNLGTYLTNAN